RPRGRRRDDRRHRAAPRRPGRTRPVAPAGARVAKPSHGGAGTESGPVRQLANPHRSTVVSMRPLRDAEIRLKRGWTSRVTGILSGYPVLPMEIANRLGGSKYGRTRTSRNPARRHEL